MYNAIQERMFPDRQGVPAMRAIKSYITKGYIEPDEEMETPAPQVEERMDSSSNNEDSEYDVPVPPPPSNPPSKSRAGDKRPRIRSSASPDSPSKTRKTRSTKKSQMR